MAYSIEQSDFVKRDDHGNEFVRVLILADTVNDIPTPLPTWVPLSLCLVADGHNTLILNTEGEWK